MKEQLMEINFCCRYILSRARLYETSCPAEMKKQKYSIYKKHNNTEFSRYREWKTRIGARYKKREETDGGKAGSVARDKILGRGARGRRANQK